MLRKNKQLSGFIDRYKNPLAKVFLFIIIFFLLTNFSIDPDFGWHLRTGQLMFENGEVVKNDMFTFTMPGYEWANSYTGYQLLIAGLYKLTNPWSLSIFFGFIGALSFLILVDRLDFYKMLIFSLAGGIAAGNIGVRPHTLSLLFFSLLILLISKKQLFGFTGLFLLGLLFAVWANVHRAFSVGLFVLALYLFFDFIGKNDFRIKSFLKQLLPLLVSMLATLVNPFFLDSWKHGVFLDLLSRDNLNVIAEWQPIVLFTPFNVLFALSGAIFVFLIFKKSNTINPVWIIVGAFMFVLSFLATLFAFFWVACFVFIVSRMPVIKISVGDSAWHRLPIYIAVSAAYLALALNFFVRSVESKPLSVRLAIDGYPLNAVDEIKKPMYFGNLFNVYQWGGFLEWQLTERKIFIDGRMASWSTNEQNILSDYVAIMQGKNCSLVNKYKLDVALVNRDFKSSCFSSWELVYEDEIAKVLVGN